MAPGDGGGDAAGRFRGHRKRVKRLMRVMGIAAIYQKPNTSLGHPAHKVLPYLLRGLVIDRANQVWCADITYVPMARDLCIWSRDGLVQPAGVVVAGVDHDGFGFLRGSAARSHGAATGGPRFLIPIKGFSSPARIFRLDWKPRRCGSAWTARGGIWTTSSSSGCGGA